MLKERLCWTLQCQPSKTLYLVYELHATGTYSQHCKKKKKLLLLLLTPSRIFWIVIHNFQNSLCSRMNNKLKYTQQMHAKQTQNEKKKRKSVYEAERPFLVSINYCYHWHCHGAYPFLTSITPAHRYGVVPKGLLTFLGSLYKEVAKTTPETLVYRFERQTAREKSISFFEKHCVLDLRM